jgi:hypothetical protein
MEGEVIKPCPATVIGNIQMFFCGLDENQVGLSKVPTS